MGSEHCFNGDAGVLHQRAVRTPLPDEDAERLFHENMLTVADARERKGDLLADPNVPVTEAYESELESVAETFRRRLRHIAGEEYERAARAYRRGERDDRVGALASYYVEGLWRIQQRSTVTDLVYFPLILRYPDSFTVNIRFASGHATPNSLRYESPQHAETRPEEGYAQQYFQESQYEQARAAEYLRETAETIREEFPAPDETTFEERKYGGIVSAGGRHGSEFSEMLTRVTPDPDRFDGPVEQATLVPTGPEARRTAQAFLADGETVL